MVWVLTVLIQIDPNASVSAEWNVYKGGEAACIQQGLETVEALKPKNYPKITFTCAEASV